MKRLLNLAMGIAMGTSLVGGGVAAQVAAPPEPQRTLVTDTRIFDGTSPSLSGPMSVLAKPEENLALIMKDGVIYKNTIK